MRMRENHRKVSVSKGSRKIATNLSLLIGALLLLQACSPELVCRAQFNSITRACIADHFKEGQLAIPLQEYLQSAGFERMTSASGEFGQRDYYLSEFDNEKGPREIVIIVDHARERITRIKIAKWQSGWLPDGSRGESPLFKCIRGNTDCEEYVDG